MTASQPSRVSQPQWRQSARNSLVQQSRSVTAPARPRRRSAPRTIGARVAGVTLVVAAHMLAIAALASYAPAREALLEVAPIVVSLVAPPRVEVAPPVPKPNPPEPKPVVRPKPIVKPKPVAPPPIIVAQAEAPSPFVTPPAPPAPPPPIDAVPPQTADPGPPAPPSALIPPRFNADYLQNPPPPYPPLARRMGEHGRVVLRVLVSSDGLPERVELRTSSGSPRLDDSALATVRRWKFVPARQGDHPVPAWVLVPISFTLQG
jgi:protein TonB